MQGFYKVGFCFQLMLFHSWHILISASLSASAPVWRRISLWEQWPMFWGLLSYVCHILFTIRHFPTQTVILIVTVLGLSTADECRFLKKPVADAFQSSVPHLFLSTWTVHLKPKPAQTWLETQKISVPQIYVLHIHILSLFIEINLSLVSSLCFILSVFLWLHVTSTFEL